MAITNTRRNLGIPFSDQRHVLNCPLKRERRYPAPTTVQKSPKPCPKRKVEFQALDGHLLVRP